MSIRTVFGAAAASLMLLVSAQAADVIVEEVVVAPAPPPPSNWTGFYAGLHAGYGWGNSDWSFQPGSFWSNPPVTGGSTSPDGFIGGGQVGYLHQNGDLVFGVDISASYADLDDTIASPAFPAFDTWQTEIDFLALAQLRAGYAYDKWLIFAQGGYAGAHAEATGTALFGFGASDSNWHNGWTVGGGVLYKPGQNWSFGAEYNYIDLQSQNYNMSVFGGNDPASISHDIHAVKATLNFHFGN
ncbi:outer membrane protein [Hoeflea poritis]|uniref:Outer membrane beta-barrel protein n=1 Tax=Hoeflea poritis TaxID=2993659 RepID=A0ABT4VKR1_9HYPH|nr:outer membrane beta-barrel protein [Hoeflea poritis]MDA4844740.1 outer membrane beta-barrel protein [Hoeflea poritis]